LNQAPTVLSRPNLQRVAAQGRIAVVMKRGRTRLARLYQEGASKIRLPACDGDPLEAILINTAGGLTGGDRVSWQVEAGEGASIALTTQACEKFYRAGHGHAEMSCRLNAASGARIAWLPQETIVFDRSAFRRTMEVDLASDAEALIVEATVFGRRAMGERVAMADFADRWRVRRDGRLVHAEEFRIGPDIGAALRSRAVAGGATAVATILHVGPHAAASLDEARAIVGDGGGASAWTVGGTGKLLARLVAADGYALRSRLIPLVELLNGRAGLPKTWSL
jgi:urease accessory protein